MTMFSVIIATRNRSVLFKKALASVIEQTCESREIIVVNDGSGDEQLADYRAIIAAAAERIQFFSLVQRHRGHGPHYSRNFGAEHATGNYLCFLDDDDSWTDPEHLTRVGRAITANAAPPDMHLSNQTAFMGNQQKPGPIWLEALAGRLEKAGRKPEPDGAYAVLVDDLLSVGGFCHLNTLVVRRALFEQVGGFDERLGYEEDHDLYLRLVDKAKTIRYAPDYVARHNIPDATKTTNASTGLVQVERRLFQVRLFEKAALFAQHPMIRAHAKRQKAYAMKRITEILVARKDYAGAFYYGLSALGAAPTMKWAAYVVWLGLRAGATRG